MEGMRRENLQTTLGILAVVLVLWACVRVLAPFAVPILWAMILGAATWPLYRRVLRVFGTMQDLAALAMTLLLCVLVVVPVTFLSLALIDEMEPEIDRFREWALADKLEVPDWVKEVPILDQQVQRLLQDAQDMKVRQEWLQKSIGPAQKILKVGRSILHRLAEGLLAVFTLFFVYRHGEAVTLEVRFLLDRVGGGKGERLLTSVKETVRAVFYGQVLTAMTQGIVAILGYWIAGLRAPVLLGVATGITAVIPFGVGIVWIPVVTGLMLMGLWGKALFVFLWVMLVVSTIDNLVRPIFISGPSKIPFILVFFGLVGGLVTHGLVGLVLGPVFLAIALELWVQFKQNLEQAAAPAGALPPP